MPTLLSGARRRGPVWPWLANDPVSFSPRNRRGAGPGQPESDHGVLRSVEAAAAVLLVTHNHIHRPAMADRRSAARLTIVGEHRSSSTLSILELRRWSERVVGFTVVYEKTARVIDPPDRAFGSARRRCFTVGGLDGHHRHDRVASIGHVPICAQARSPSSSRRQSAAPLDVSRTWSAAALEGVHRTAARRKVVPLTGSARGHRSEAARRALRGQAQRVAVEV